MPSDDLEREDRDGDDDDPGERPATERASGVSHASSVPCPAAYRERGRYAAGLRGRFNRAARLRCAKRSARRDLAVLEAQAGEAVATHELVAASRTSGRGHEDEAADRQAVAGVGWHDMHGRRDRGPIAHGPVAEVQRAAASTLWSSARGGVERGPHRLARRGGGRAHARREGEVGDRREALLVLAQREQQVRDAVGRRQRRLVARARTSSARAGRGTSSAPASPTSQTPSAPRSITSPVRACSSRASWPTRSPSSPSARRSGPRRRRARLRLDAPSRRGWRTARGSPTRGRAGSPPPAATAGRARTARPRRRTNGTVWATVVSVHTRPRAASAGVRRRAAASGRPRSREGPRCSPARDRAAQDHELGVERQLVDLPARPSPSLTTA